MPSTRRRRTSIVALVLVVGALGVALAIPISRETRAERLDRLTERMDELRARTDAASADPTLSPEQFEALMAEHNALQIEYRALWDEIDAEKARESDE